MSAAADGAAAAEGADGAAAAQAAAAGSYAWEQTARSWEDLEEDASGQLRDAAAAAHYKRQRLEYASRSAKRRMVRYVVLVLDLSSGLADHDLRPNRFSVFRTLVEQLIDTFFDQNPVSQLGVVVTRNKRAALVSQVGGSPSQHKKNLERSWSEDPSGQPSLQQALQVATTVLLQTPTYGSREILVMYGSVHTVDSGDIHATIASVADHGIRASVVGVGASVNVCQVLANRTSGFYHVGGDEEQLRELVLFHATPPPLTPQMLREFPAELIEMGFPQHLRSDVEVLSAVTHEFVKEGYLCPRCKAMLEELPSTCPICRLSCVASPHLARSFHHLFPVPLFEKVARSEAAAAAAAAPSPRPVADDKVKEAAADKAAAAAAATRTCGGCSRCIRPEEMCFRCPRPNALQTVDAAAAPEGLATRRTGMDEVVYCMDCDVFIHDVLHNTPPPVSAAAVQRVDEAARRAGEGDTLQIKEEAHT